MLSVSGGRGSRKIISFLLQNKRKAIVNKNLSVLEGAVVGALVFMYRFDNDDLAIGE
jgi:limonene-1,2-epoxide hydrolase